MSDAGGSPYPSGWANDPDQPARRPPGRSRVLVIGAIALVLVAAIGIAVALTTHHRSSQHEGAPPTPSASTSPAHSDSTTAPATTGVAPVTVITPFEPFTPTGLSPQVPTSPNVPGRCGVHSVIVEAAFVCVAAGGGASVEDPCFSNKYDTTDARMVCGDPWNNFLLTRTGRLPPAPSAGTPKPWALELSNGAHCFGARNAGVIDSVTMDFVCFSDGSAGNLTATQQPWTVQYAPNRAPPLATVTVVHAWVD